MIRVRRERSMVERGTWVCCATFTETTLRAIVYLLLLVPALASAQDKPLAAVPYSPSFDLASMDRSAKPCTDFYQYVCGGWMKSNPIPADKASWSVYGKLEDENLQFLWGILQDDATTHRALSPSDAKIGAFFASCMDTAAIEARGLHPLDAQLAEIAALKSKKALPKLLGTLQRDTLSSGFLFGFGSDQDWANAEHVLAELSGGGLGLPDRDYYFKTDAKSVETRQKYVGHVQRMLELLGDAPAKAESNAGAIMKLETALAKAQLTLVQKRDPHQLAHHETLAQLRKMAPGFDWPAYFAAAGAPDATFFNVTEPAYMAEVSRALRSTSLSTLEAYLRWQLVHARSHQLTQAISDERFAFYGKYLEGQVSEPRRWKRCVGWTDDQLGEALGQAFVARVFSPDVKKRTDDMTAHIETAMARDIGALDWMSPATRKAALEKLHLVVNKVGYPAHWRDYSKLHIDAGDFAGNMQRADTFEWDRQLAKIGKPLDRGEWQMTAPTVDAYYNPQMNDINFPAGVLQPPLFDAKMDDAPNDGNTGSTIGHELTHAFDDEGCQFDGHGNLRNWWAPEDATRFKARTQCVVNEYGGFQVVDDIKENSKLTLGEDVADLGGTLLAYAAWKDATKNVTLRDIDGFTPDQRFFIGFAQWACSNERPALMRLRAATDPHSVPKWRVNGVLQNIPEFAKAFSCTAGSPMVSAKPCRVW